MSDSTAGSDAGPAKAGVIGLGAIGGGVAACLARASRPLAVYDVRPQARGVLEGVPELESCCADVARRSDVVMIAVVDAAQVEAALTGPRGLLAGAHPGLTAVVLSTISLTQLEALVETAATAGVTLIDCGVTGGPAAARRGLVSLVGADTETFERVRPVLEDFSHVVLHMGPVGAGMTAKIARNVVVYTIWRAAYEGALLAERAGLDMSKLVEAMDISARQGGGPTTWLKRGPDQARDPSPERRRQLEQVLTLMDKDLDAALELSRRLGVELPMTALTRATGAAIIGLTDVRGTT